jgi:uncharacterized protein (TIGR02147 family)
MNKLDVYDFSEPRDFLADVLQEKQSTNPRFSLRAWSKQLGLASPAALSLILRGERRLQPDLVAKIADSLKLKREEQNYLQVLTLYSNSSSETEKQLYSDLLKQLRPDKEFSTLTLDRFRTIADWHHFAIYEMVDLRDFREDSAWIAERLESQITPTMASDAIERLIRLQLLSRSKDGHLRKSNQSQVFTTTDVPSDALKKYHTQMLEKAIQALKSQNVQEREISSNTIAIDKKRLPEAKKVIRRFQNEIAELCESSAAHEVYQLNVQFFRITKEK